MALVLTPVPGNAARVECNLCPASTIVPAKSPQRLQRLLNRLGSCPSCGK